MNSVEENGGGQWGGQGKRTNAAHFCSLKNCNISRGNRKVIIMDENRKGIIYYYMEPFIKQPGAKACILRIIEVNRRGK